MEAYLPPYCYRDEELVPTAIVIHFLSCIYVQPNDPFNMHSNWMLAHDLNAKKEQRMMFLKGKDDPVNEIWGSYHCLVGRDGTQMLLVPENKQAFHAGISSLRGKSDFNRCALGVAGLATARSGFEEEQYLSLAKYCGRACREFGIDVDWIVGHEEVAPGRKVDPGMFPDPKTGYVNFDMPRLHEQTHKFIVNGKL